MNTVKWFILILVGSVLAFGQKTPGAAGPASATMVTTDSHGKAQNSTLAAAGITTGMFNVLTYGAVGSSNDSATFQAAINAANNSGFGGGVVTIPAGTYHFTTKLDLKNTNGVEIYCLSNMTGSGDDSLAVNLLWDGTSGSLMTTEGAASLKIHGCNFAWTSGSYNSILVDLKQGTGTINTNGVQIYDNRFGGLSTSSKTGTCLNVVDLNMAEIHDNFFINCTVPIQGPLTSHFANNVTIGPNNWFDRRGGPAIVAGGQGWTIKGNVYEPLAGVGSSQQILSITNLGLTNLVVIGDEAYDGGSTGVEWDLTGGVVKGLVFQGNQASFGLTGLSLGSANGVQVSGNYFAGLTTAVVAGSATNVMIYANNWSNSVTTKVSGVPGGESIYDNGTNTVTVGFVSFGTAPTSPTPAAADNSTTVATTAYVTTGITNAVNAAAGRDLVNAATAAVLPNTPTFTSVAAGIGSFYTSSTNSVLVVDGYTPVLNDRILVKNQATASRNGIYKVTQLGVNAVTPWIITRALDYDQASDINNTIVPVAANGTANPLTSWIQTATVTTVDTDTITFASFTPNGANIVTAASPGVGLCHFAGSTQTCTSSAVVNADVTSIDAASKLTGLTPLANGGTNCATPYAINAQTSTYQVVAADFTCFKTITVASGTFTITLVASGSQPAAGTWIKIINYGSGVVTVARSGQNINGGTASLTIAAASATAPTEAEIWSDATNYFGNITVSAGVSAETYFQTAGYTIASAVTQTANHTFCGGVIIPKGGLSVGHIAVWISTGDGGSGALGDIGIYDNTGARAAHIGAQTLVNTGTGQTFAFSGGTQTIVAGRALICVTDTAGSLILGAAANQATWYAVQDIAVTTSSGALASSITMPTAVPLGWAAVPQYSFTLYP